MIGESGYRDDAIWTVEADMLSQAIWHQSYQSWLDVDVLKTIENDTVYNWLMVLPSTLSVL